MRPRFASDSKTRPDTSHRRALVIVCVLVVWMLCIAVRLVYLQTIQHDKLLKDARAQQLHLDENPNGSLRGRLLDREGHELALSIEMDSCYAEPNVIKNVDETAARLASLVGIDAKELTRRFKEANESKVKFIWLARRIDDARAKEIMDLKLDGVGMRREPKRFYPNGSLAAHVLGFVGLDEVGLGGIERFQNKRMQGEQGKVFVETDARGTGYESMSDPMRAGQSVVLTIDQMIQYHAEQSLKAAIERTRARSGTVIVLDPRTG